MGDSLESYNRYVKEQSSKGNENRSSFRPFHRIFQFIWPQESNRISQYKQILIRSTVFVLIIIIVIEVWEHVPSPKLTDVHMDNGTFPVIVKRDAAISIPLMSILFPTERNIEVDIYHNDSIHILNVGLSTNSSDSLLTYDFNFTNVTKKILPKPTVANSTNKLEEYYLDLTLYHNLGISNSSNPYILNIVYTNNTEDLHSLPLKFDLPVKTLDLNILSYFGLILIGVISSRTLTRVLELIEKKKKEYHNMR